MLSYVHIRKSGHQQSYVINKLKLQGNIQKTQLFLHDIAYACVSIFQTMTTSVYLFLYETEVDIIRIVRAETLVSFYLFLLHGYYLLRANE